MYDRKFRYGTRATAQFISDGPTPEKCPLWVAGIEHDPSPGEVRDLARTATSLHHNIDEIARLIIETVERTER